MLRMAVASGPEGSRTWYAASSNSMVGAEETWLGKQEQVRKAGRMATPRKIPSNDNKELFSVNSTGKMACSHKNQSVFTPEQCLGKRNFICDFVEVVFLTCFLFKTI